jgi:hypothetical protein
MVGPGTETLTGQHRQVLRGTERDAAVRAAADWYRQNRNADSALAAIADRFNISMTAAGHAIVLAIAMEDGDG